MSASSTDARVTPGNWFLLAPGGSASMRIAPGLTLGEGSDGRLLLSPRHSQDVWVVFEADAGGLWLQVVSDAWRLAKGNHAPTERVRLDGRTSIRLPHHLFDVGASLTHAEPSPRTEVALVPNRPRLEAATPDPGAGVDNTRVDAPVVVRFPVARRHRPVPSVTPALETPRVIGETTTRRALQPAVYTPARRARSRRTAPRRDAATANSGRRLGKHFTSVLLAITCLLIPVGSNQLWSAFHPAGQADGHVSLAETFPIQRTAPASVGPGTLLEDVEALLRGREQSLDPETLKFALEAYRLALLDKPDDGLLLRRRRQLAGTLSELEARPGGSAGGVTPR